MKKILNPSCKINKFIVCLFSRYKYRTILDDAGICYYSGFMLFLTVFTPKVPNLSICLQKI